jgi:hypothetical protein
MRRLAPRTVVSLGLACGLAELAGCRSLVALVVVPAILRCGPNTRLHEPSWMPGQSASISPSRIAKTASSVRSWMSSFFMIAAR